MLQRQLLHGNLLVLLKRATSLDGPFNLILLLKEHILAISNRPSIPYNSSDEP